MTVAPECARLPCQWQFRDALRKYLVVEFSVEQMMAFLLEKIVSARGAVSLSDVLPDLTSRRALITAFLALLELTRLHAVYLKQDKPFGEITARANPDYELSKSFSPA